MNYGQFLKTLSCSCGVLQDLLIFRLSGFHPHNSPAPRLPHTRAEPAGVITPSRALPMPVIAYVPVPRTAAAIPQVRSWHLYCYQWTPEHVFAVFRQRKRYARNLPAISLQERNKI